ncbi:MAG: hypothetical protein ACFE75_02495 [Candidatus Hodarchaeota archaeon]
MIDNRNWYERDKGLHFIYETYNDLKYIPQNFKDLLYWIDKMEYNKEELTKNSFIQLLRVIRNNQFLLDQAKEEFSKRKLLSKTSFNQMIRNLSENKKFHFDQKMSRSKSSPMSNLQKCQETYEKLLIKFSLTKKEVIEWCKDFNSKIAKEKIEIIDKNLGFDITRERIIRMLAYFEFILNGYMKLKKKNTFQLFRGDRSLGKNYLIDRISQLIPEEQVERIQTLTNTALKYDNSLVGKRWLIIDEIFENQTTLLEILKPFYDRQIFRHKYTENLETKTEEIPVPVIITSFSFENPNDDILDRSIFYNVDPSQSQTRKIFREEIKHEENSIERLFENEKIEKERFLISQTIKYIDWEWDLVKIKFVRQYLMKMFPKIIPRRARRDKDLLQDLIRFFAIWNQDHRLKLVIGNKKVLWANSEDLILAIEYFEDVLHSLTLDIDLIKKFILKFVVLGDKFTITQIWKHIKSLGYNITRKTAERKIFDLVDKGYFDKRKSKNKWKFWKLKDFDTIKNLNLNTSEIDDLVYQDYNYYKNIKEEMLK